MGAGFSAFAPGLWLSVRESATTRWTREADDPGARARVERPPRPGGAATLVVSYKIDRGREGEGVKTATTKLRKMARVRPYSSSTTEALARDSTRGSVGLSSRPSGLFFPVDLREERHRAETDTATTALRRFDVASTAPAGIRLFLS